MESCSLSNSGNCSYNDEFLMLDPRLIDFEEEEEEDRHDSPSSVPISTTSLLDTKLPIEYITLSDTYYIMK